MEKRLDYDRSIVPQDTSYWCGPGAAQIVLNGRGLNVPESVLAAEMGTDTAGTDYIQLVERALNRYLPEADYVSVELRRDPPTQAQRDALMSHIVSSIDAGYGLVMNWVAPPSNYPRGVKGSVSPRYGPGTIWHYVACMGYDTDFPAVWIADSGFSPQGFWISLDQCATLIPPKGYTYATARAVVPPEPGPAEPLSVEEQREMLELMRELAGYRRVSRSPLRRPGEREVDSIAGLMWATDGSVHVLLMHLLARLGDPEALTRLHEVAAMDLAAFPDREYDRNLAVAILTDVGQLDVPAAPETPLSAPVASFLGEAGYLGGPVLYDPYESDLGSKLDALPRMDPITDNEELPR